MRPLLPAFLLIIRKKKLLPCLLFLITGIASFSQNLPLEPSPGIKWNKYQSFRTSGNTDIVYDAQQLGDRGYIVVGCDSTWNITSQNVLAKTLSGHAMIARFDSSGNKIWSTLGGDHNFNAAYTSVTQTTDGGFVAAGYRKVFSQADGFDFFISKFNANGQPVWHKELGGSKDDIAYDIITTMEGGYMVVGITLSSDGDLPNPFTLTQTAAWMVKLNESGNITWQQTIRNSGNNADSAFAVLQTPDSGYIVVGSSRNAAQDNFGGADGWEFKVDKLGNLKWAHNEGGQSDDAFRSIVAMPGGEYLALGYARLDQGAIPTDDYNVYIGFIYDEWDDLPQEQIPSSGFPTFGGTNNDYGLDIKRTINNEYLITGFTSSNDVQVSGHNGGTDSWVMLLGKNEVGGWQPIWQRPIGTINNDYGVATFELPNDEYQVISFGPNPTPAQYDEADILFTRLGNTNTIKGTLFLDVNSNGIKDAGEMPFDAARVKAEKGDSVNYAIPYNGQFELNTDEGTYTVTVSVNHPYYTVVPASHTSTFTGYFNTDSIGFAIQPTTVVKDLAINLLPTITPARPGFNVPYQLVYYNLGTVNINDAVIKLVKDPRLIPATHSPAPTAVSGDTLIWEIATIPPLSSSNITLNFIAQTPPVLNVNDTLSFIAWIDPVNEDATPADDTAILKHVVRGSYDPNDKTESNAGSVTARQVQQGKYLNYLIRFQNTGTDTAFTVVIRDTLDAQLDWNSLEMIDASHPYKTIINDSNKVTWTFNNILLADSNVNEPASHGYIAYRIKPKSTLPTGARIRNSASIYFDFNLPVQTNTQETLVRVDAPDQPEIDGLESSYCNNAGTKKIKVQNLPAAASGITVTAKVDNATVTIAADSTISININALAAGSHLLTLSYSNAGGTRMSQNNFTVDATVTPEVNVNANITNVTNLATPVTVTATNAAGGGTTPLYTFAKDKNFTTIVQAEGAAATLTIDPNTLTIGDNKYFVRMKTSATCYTAQTNIDSITIRRDQSTGITDADNPGKSINVYPNPFRKDIFINGLLAGKSYVITIYNLQGQQLYTKRVSNRSSVSCTYNAASGGVYWLSIYDEKKKQLLGSVKLIKE